MRNKITRKLTETVITGYSVEVREDGKPELIQLEPLTVFGVVSDRTALRELKRANPDKNGVTVATINTEDVQYEIPVEDFVQIATRIEPKKAE